MREGLLGTLPPSFQTCRVAAVLCTSRKANAGPAVRRIEYQSFLLLLAGVTLAFAWVLAPFYGAILWAIVVAVIFVPVQRRLETSMRGRRGLAAAVTVLIIIAMVILPLAVVAASLVQEA